MLTSQIILLYCYKKLLFFIIIFLFIYLITPIRRDKSMKKIKRKKRSAKDPLAPKKPANPFLQYCLEKRATVVGEMISSGTAEPSKQDITKQLASNWKTLSNKNKMVMLEFNYIKYVYFNFSR